MIVSQRFQQTRRWLLPISIVVLTLFWTGPRWVAQAEDLKLDDPKAVAQAFLGGFDREVFRETYQKLVGHRAKQVATEEAFVAQASILLRQMGGAGQGRAIIDQRASNTLPEVGSGNFYTFRFKSSRPAGQVYEDVVLEKESDEKWRVLGFWFYPAPPG